ncbi:metal-dependent hydrolase [Gimibacter soli]|uniref:Metal-dependent hydrolase n=1 Tax=Gimibacter soli TaxID=3024400 RepID=A0AAF0BN51_9PROT|nr:metal-dependent hydrolase [Gimibacter soli]WCL55545.1 metal-dependent hydrolase [Gimibacter soli]
MANRVEHEIIGAIAGGTVAALNNDAKDQYAVNFAAGAFLGKVAARLPDLLEPAIHPNHRGFFHSWLFLSVLGAGMVKLWEWEPEATNQKVLKWALLVTGAAYASHLLRDSITPKSLPIV